MSKLDELLDEISCGDWDDDHPLVLAARAELAALRQRAEDAEMIVRCYSHRWVYYFGTGETMCMVTVKPATLEVPETYQTALHRDPATGLPILTDEVRKAMQ